jgi:hypothetical protein
MVLLEEDRTSSLWHTTWLLHYSGDGSKAATPGDNLGCIVPHYGASEAKFRLPVTLASGTHVFVCNMLGPRGAIVDGLPPDALDEDATSGCMKLYVR